MYIKVRVIAGAKKELIKKLSKTSYKLSVKEPALQNRANARVIAIIAEECGVPVASVRIINGHHSPSKMLSVDVAQ